MSFLSVDFETRSLVDLRAAGVYVYAEHWSTDVMCMAYAVPGAEPKLWWPGDPVPRVVTEVLRRGLPFRAWNAGFEYVIWRDILGPRYGFPPVPMEAWADTAAEAAAMALPRALGKAARVLGLPEQKDVEGGKLLAQMCAPRCVGAWWVRGSITGGPFATRGDAEDWRKARSLRPKQVEIEKDDHTILWWDDAARLERLGEYCRQDVRTEMAVAARVRPLSGDEREVYLMNQRMNDRGIYVDLPLVAAASEIMERATTDANNELCRITDGRVRKVTQVHEIKSWVQEQGVLLPDLAKDTVRDALKAWPGGASEDARRVLTIRQETGKTSTAKIAAFQACTAKDSRAHGLLLYHGATTGRWAGRLVQPHNFPRPELNPVPFIAPVLARDYGALLGQKHSPAAIIASMLRSMLRAAPGNELFAADYSQIEARVLAWIAGQDDLVALFASGGKVYETMAAFIFNKAVEEITKDSFERQIGKGSVLGAGFQMGPDRFAEQVREQTGIVLDRGEKIVRCAACGSEARSPVSVAIPVCCTEPDRHATIVREDMAAKAITAYRTLYARIPQFWKDIERAAINAVLEKGEAFYVGPRSQIRFKYRGQFLWCRLPSGRQLAYALPQIRQKRLPEPYQDVIKDSLTYCAEDSMTRQWRRHFSYGGHLTENVVQAMARDLMAGGMLRVERAGFEPVLTVHDEVVCEGPKGSADFEEFMSLMQTVPQWAAGIPLAADGWHGERYRK